MTIMTTTEFAKNIKKTLDRLEFGGEEIIIVRNKNKIARIIPSFPHLTAIEAMGDIYRILEPEAAVDWIEDSWMEGKVAEEMRDQGDF